ncbi:MAG: glycosyltransferase [Thermosynechococcaceae cyanobacterium]
MVKPLNILISAYACRPKMGSEPGVGWSTASEIAKYEKVWVVTRNDNRPFIEAERAEHPISNLEFIYCDVPSALGWVCKSGQLTHYYLWQIVAYFTIKRLHPDLNFDLIHHVTYVRYSTPSFLAFLPIPFIWGAVGGGEMAPSSFWQDFNLRARLYEVARMMAHRLGEIDPFTRLTIRKSALVRATTKDTAARLICMGAVNPEIFPESALPLTEIEALGQYPPPLDGGIRFISMARLLHWKGLHLGIRSFAQAKLPDNSEYWIFGEGPERASLEKLAQSLGVSQQVQFLGCQPRSETLQNLSQCHGLVHPSLHDSGGWVCVEAMAMGKPVICLDLGGPSTQVTAQTGIKVQAQTPQQAVDGLAEAMSRLAQDSTLRSTLGEAGRVRATTIYSWEGRSKHLVELYHRLANRSVPSPDAASNKLYSPAGYGEK